MDHQTVDLRAIWIIKSIFDGHDKCSIVTGVGIAKKRILTCDHGFDLKTGKDMYVRPSRILACRVEEGGRYYEMKVVVNRQAWDLCILTFTDDPPTDLVSLNISQNQVLKIMEEILLIGHGHGQKASHCTGKVAYPCKKEDPATFKNKFPFHFETNANPNIPLVICQGMEGGPGSCGGPFIKNGEIVAVNLGGDGFFNVGAHVSAIHQIVKEADMAEGSTPSTS